MVKKRANNTGTVYKDNVQGGYRAQLVLPDGRRISKRFPDSDLEDKPAQDWLIEQQYKLNKGQFINPTDLTLGDWLVEWLKIYSKQNVRQRTFERYLSLAKHAETIADIRLQDLKPNNFQKLYVSLGQYSGETRKKLHNLLHQALDQAVHDQLIPYNPIDAVTIPKAVREEVVTFRKEEVEALLTAAKDHHWYAALLLASHTGMRLGEILGLRWQDVDFNNKCVNVMQTLQHPSTGIIFEPPKSKTSKRKIALPLQTMDALREHRKNCMDNLALINNPNGLCFTSKTGTPIQPRNFERWWEGLQKKANPVYMKIAKQKERIAKQGKKDSLEYLKLKKDMEAVAKACYKKFHSLRHTHATELLASGENIMDVARRLGHSKASTTLDLYGHAIPGNDERIADKVGNLYNIGTQKSQLPE